MRITARSNKYDMEGIPLALVTERSPMLKLLVIGNLECILKVSIVNLRMYASHLAIAQNVHCTYV